MNSIERVQTTINLGIPDRVQVDLHNFQPAAKTMGISMIDVFQKGELLAEAMINAWREFGHDMILVENGTACSAQACGVEVIYRDDAAPVARSPVISKLEDLEKLKIPDPYTAFPMCEVIKATRIIAKEIGDKVWICGRADQGPTDLSSQLMGMDNLLMENATDENDVLIHRLFDFSREVATRYAYALIESGAHSTSIGEPVAGPDVMSPRHYRKYAFQPEQKMVDDLKAKGIILHNHICGNTIPIIHEFIATGAQVLEIDHKTDLSKAKEAGKGKTCFLGPVDTSVLAVGTSQEVEDACRTAIEIMAPGGGFILGPGCALSPETPANNIHALVESVKKYGVYS